MIKAWHIAVLAVAVVVAHRYWPGDGQGELPHRPVESIGGQPSLRAQSDQPGETAGDEHEPASKRPAALASGKASAPGSSDLATDPQSLANEPPLGPLAERDVLDREIDVNPDGSVTRRFLLKGLDDVIRYVLQEETYVERGGEILVTTVRMKADEVVIDADARKVDPDALRAFMADHGLSVERRSRFSDVVQLRWMDVSLEKLRRVLEDARARFPETTVEADLLFFPAARPSEYNPALLWHLDQVVAEDAWDFETGDSEVIVAVIDTGIEASHPDLSANLFRNEQEVAGNGVDDDGNQLTDDISGYDFHDDDATPDDETGHGTHVSGIAGAVGGNGVGVSGVAWGIKVLPLKVGGSGGLANSAINEALRYARSLKERGYNIVATNNSYGSGSPSQFTREEIENHMKAGILFVAAAGNDGVNMDDASQEGSQEYPAGYPLANIIAVANSNQGDELSPASNYGAISADLAAPGSDVYSTHLNGGYTALSGTSMASPMVAGAAALLASHEPSLSWDRIKARLLDTADRIPAMEGKLVSGGRLNLLAALEPTLSRHRIELPHHRGRIVILQKGVSEALFEIDALPGASVEARALGPQAGSAAIEVSGREVVARFAEDGFYRIEFSATLAGIERRTERMVLAGEPGDVTSGLIHYWDFEGSGSAVEDKAGSADGSLVGASRATTPFGQGGDFSGQSSHLTFNATSTSQVTIAAYAHLDRLDSSPHPRIVNTPDYYLYVSSSGGQNVPDGNRDTLKFYSNRTGDFGVWNAQPESVEAGRWMHALATYDSSSLENAPALFIDGVPQRVRVQRSPTGSQTLAGGASFVGDNDDGTRAFDGRIDEVRIYNRVLDATEAAVLASRYQHVRWQGYQIVARTALGVGEPVEFALQDQQGQSPAASYRWRAEAADGTQAAIEGNGEPAVNITFPDGQAYRVSVSVSDGHGAFVAGKEVFPQPVDLEAGLSVGEVGEDGRVWVEVSEDLTSGYVTLIDPPSGFYRLREPIAIDALGKFSTDADLPQGRISGSLDGGLSGAVSGYGISFAGERLESLSQDSGYAGEYLGGLLNADTLAIELRVLESGDAFAWAYNDDLALGSGMVYGDGEFQLPMSDGSVLSGMIDAEKDQVVGSRTVDGTSFDFFLRGAADVGSNRFVNLSTRGFVETGDGALIGGFVVRGDKPRRMMIRAVGPSLALSDVPNTLADPKLEIFRRGTPIAENEVWGEVANLADLREAMAAVAAGPFIEGSLDAALLLDLEPGPYTAVVRGQGEAPTGEALVEIFHMGTSPQSLVNVSTRGMIRGSGQPLIAGFVVRGDSPKQVLIRLLGPALEGMDVENPLPDGQIRLVKNNVAIAGNDNWMEGARFLNEGESGQGSFRDLEDAFVQLGAPHLETESTDSAMLVWLTPGPYTAVGLGVDGAEGIALIEVYEMP